MSEDSNIKITRRMIDPKYISNKKLKEVKQFEQEYNEFSKQYSYM